MSNKKLTLNEEISRIKSLVSFKYGDLILEQEESFESFDFSNFFPDNIAYPIPPNVPITSVNQIYSQKNLLIPTLIEFIDRLKAKVLQNVKIDTIRIKSGASPERATKVIPDGYTEDLVNKSFSDVESNKIKIDNTILAKNRAKVMEKILKSYIPELENVNFEINDDLKEKVVIVEVPTSVLVNLQKKFPKEYISTGGVPYKPSLKKPTNRMGCKVGSTISAKGYVGEAPEYIADRILFDDFSGNITFMFDALEVPDRFQIKAVSVDDFNSDNDKNPEIIFDSLFVSSADDYNFKLLQDEIMSLSKYKNPSEFKKGGKGQFNFTTKPGKKYFVDVIAPLGSTIWKASLICGKTEYKSMSRGNWGLLNPILSKVYGKKVIDGNIIYSDATIYFNNDLDNTKYYVENSDEYNQVISKGEKLYKYMKGDFKFANNGPVLIDGVKYIYDTNGNEINKETIKVK